MVALCGGLSRQPEKASARVWYPAERFAFTSFVAEPRHGRLHRLRLARTVGGGHGGHFRFRKLLQLRIEGERACAVIAPVGQIMSRAVPVSTCAVFDASGR